MVLIFKDIILYSTYRWTVIFDGEVRLIRDHFWSALLATIKDKPLFMILVVDKVADSNEGNHHDNHDHSYHDPRIIRVARRWDLNNSLHLDDLGIGGDYRLHCVVCDHRFGLHRHDHRLHPGQSGRKLLDACRLVVCIGWVSDDTNAKSFDISPKNRRTKIKFTILNLFCQPVLDLV